MHERALRRADELGPAIVDVLSERRSGISDLAVDDQVDQVLGLVLLHAPTEESELAGSLLTALAKVAFVERESKLAIFQDEVFAGGVVPASVHERVEIKCGIPAMPQRLHALLQPQTPAETLGSPRGDFGALRAMQGVSSPDATILVVEDHHATRTFLADNLTADGYELVEADCARDALRLTASCLPDLAIVDLGPPDSDGLELVRDIRAADRLAGGIDPELPVLVLSGRTRELDRLRAFDRGCDDFLGKPFRSVVRRQNWPWRKGIVPTVRVGNENPVVLARS